MTDTRKIAEQYLRVARALKVAMDISLSSTDMNVGKYTSYRAFARRYNTLVEEITKASGAITTGINRFNTENMRAPGDLTWPQQKLNFDMVYAETLILIASLEGISGGSERAVSEINQFFLLTCRRAIFKRPEIERDVQDVVEALLIGRGFQKGTEYDRETGRVKFSGKEFVPDFVLLPQSVAIEVKLIKDGQRVKDVIDEMNADIAAFKTKYERVLFVVYDLGFVRDEYEFRSGLEKIEGVDVCLVKH